MSDYENVGKALAGGADPVMLCATCPWDRYCITPPTMTRADIDAEMAKAQRQEDERSRQARMQGKETMPVGSLLTAILFSGRDTAAQVCPVFALRLRSSGGRVLADEVKARMQGWDDQR